MPDGSTPERAPLALSRRVPHSLEWLAAEIKGRVTFDVYTRVRHGGRALVEARELLLPIAGECETRAWRTGTRERNARTLLRHVEPALAALQRVRGAEDLAAVLEEIRDEIASRVHP